MSSGALNAAAQQTGGGRAARPGPRRWLAAALVAAIAAAVVLVVALTSGGGRATPKPATAGYGKLPSWLPKFHPSNKLEVATAAKPILSEEQGLTVHAELGEGTTDVTIAGPQIPAAVATHAQDGQWPSSKPAPGTFDVSFADVKGTVPLSARAFSILTNSGQIVHPVVRVIGGGALPAKLTTGQHINLKVTGGVYEGEGSIRWAPLGPKVLVGWIYQLELD